MLNSPVCGQRRWQGGENALTLFLGNRCSQGRAIEWKTSQRGENAPIEQPSEERNKPDESNDIAGGATERPKANQDEDDASQSAHETASARSQETK